MIVLKILGIVILLFVLACQIRASIYFEIVDGRINFIAWVCGIPVLHKNMKRRTLEELAEAEAEEPERKKEKKKKEKTNKESRPFFKLDLYDIAEIAEISAKALRNLFKAFNCSRLMVHFTAASWDPYLTAKMSAYADAILSVAVPLINDRNRCKVLDIRTSADFSVVLPSLDFGICISFRIGSAIDRLISVASGLGWVYLKAICRFLRMKLFDKEEYDFRMNQQESPARYFSRIIRELKDTQESCSSASADDSDALHNAAEEYAKRNGFKLQTDPPFEKDNAEAEADMVNMYTSVSVSDIEEQNADKH